MCTAIAYFTVARARSWRVTSGLQLYSPRNIPYSTGMGQEHTHLTSIDRVVASNTCRWDTIYTCMYVLLATLYSACHMQVDQQRGWIAHFLLRGVVRCFRGCKQWQAAAEAIRRTVTYLTAAQHTGSYGLGSKPTKHRSSNKARSVRHDVFACACALSEAYKSFQSYACHLRNSAVQQATVWARHTSTPGYIVNVL